MSSLSVRITARPSSVAHRFPANWQTATGAPEGPAAWMWATLRLCLLVMMRAIPAAGSYVTPTGTTCGVPSGRGVVSVHTWRSRQKAR